MLPVLDCRAGGAGSLADAVASQEILDELAVAGRNHLLEAALDLRVAAVALERRGRDDYVDGVRQVADLFLDPRQLHIQLVGGTPESPEHSNAPGLGDRGHDVTAMAEGEDRKFGADLPGEGCSHFFSLTARPRGRAGSSHPGGRLRSGL